MKLYAHQQKIIDADPKKTGLFLGTGSGKTRIALLLSRGRVLVIAPKTQVLDQNWEREWMKIVGIVPKDAKISTLKVVSKETFRSMADLLEPFDTVIVDEAHTCLGMTPNLRTRKRVTVPKASQLYEALEAYLARCTPSRLYLVTATITKSPMTVFAGARILGKIPGEMSHFYQFRHSYYTKLPMPGREVYAPKYTKEAKESLAQMVKDMGYLGRLEDFFDVPDQTYKTIHIELTERQKKRIKDMTLEYPDPIVRVGKRHQVENGVLSGDEFTAPETFENGKIEKILELAIEFPKMIVFAKYREQIKAIQEALTGARVCTWTLTGDTKDRAGVIKQANELDGVLIVQSQISAGWETPNIPVMVFASRTYSLVDYIQGLGRIQRADHIKKNLYINLVVKGGVDEALDKALTNKQDFHEKLYAENN